MPDTHRPGPARGFPCRLRPHPRPSSEASGLPGVSVRQAGPTQLTVAAIEGDIPSSNQPTATLCNYLLRCVRTMLLASVIGLDDFSGMSSVLPQARGSLTSRYQEAGSRLIPPGVPSESAQQKRAVMRCAIRGSSRARYGAVPRWAIQSLLMTAGCPTSVGGFQDSYFDVELCSQGPGSE